MRLENVQNLPKNDQNQPKKCWKSGKLTQNNPKNAQVTAKFLLRTKTAGLPLKILMLVTKPTGKLLPSFRHNLHLCCLTCFMMNYALICQNARKIVDKNNLRGVPPPNDPEDWQDTHSIASSKTLYSSHCTLHDALYTLHLTWYFTHCTLHIAHYTLHFTHCIWNVALNTFHFTHSTLHIALYTFYSTCCTLQSKMCNV